MTNEEFARDLANVVEVSRVKVVELVTDAQNAEGLAYDTTESVSFAEDPAWQRQADALAELAGWIHDRLHGRNRLSRGSVTKRIRRALGYTVP